MTGKERLAYRALLAEEKACATSSEGLARMLRAQWTNTDPDSLRLLDGGSDLFLVRLRDRILRDHATEVVLKRCPKCGAITRTPKARQCFDCGHDWH
jgi:hypothetical protein